MVQVTEKASSWAPYRYDPDVIKRADPNKRRRWLIPLVLLAQIAFKARHCPLLSEEQLCSETLCICRTGFFFELACCDENGDICGRCAPPPMFDLAKL